MKSILRFFSSVKLAIVLLIIITLASILGTLVPQGRSAAEYAARYGHLSGVLIRLEVTNLYSSWWYLGLLFFFSLNTIICTLTRLSPKLKQVLHPGLGFEAKKLKAMKVSAAWEEKTDTENVKKALTAALASRRYRLKEKRKKDLFFVLGQRKRLGKFGSDFVHLGLLIILAGGIISGMTGFRRNLFLYEKEILPVPHRDFSLRLDKFKTDYYASGRVKDWKSTLTVIDGQKEVQTKVVEVNHPLTYKGVVFYQSSYGWDWESPSVKIKMSRKDEPDVSDNITLKIGEKAVFKDQNLEIHALYFIPDFILNEKNEAATRSRNPNNPAVFIKVMREGEEVFSGWLFSKYPDFAQMHSQKENTLLFRFVDFSAAQYSGIQMAIDPGVDFIWTGCAVLMLGFFIAFYWPTREIRTILESWEKGKTRVVVGGLAPKNRESFKHEFEEIIRTIRRDKP